MGNGFKKVKCSTRSSLDGSPLERVSRTHACSLTFLEIAPIFFLLVFDSQSRVSVAYLHTHRIYLYTLIYIYTYAYISQSDMCMYGI